MRFIPHLDTCRRYNPVVGIVLTAGSIALLLDPLHVQSLCKDDMLSQWNRSQLLHPLRRHRDDLLPAVQLIRILESKLEAASGSTARNTR